MLPAHRCLFPLCCCLTLSVTECVCLCVGSKSADGCSAVKQVNVCVCVWLRCSQLWRRAFLRLSPRPVLSPSAYGPSLFAFVLQCHCAQSLSLSPLFPLSLYLSLILLRHSPHPPSPCFRFFAPSRSFFCHSLFFLSLFRSRSACFFSVPSEDRLTDKWPSPEGGGGGVSELDMFLFSLSSVCVSVLARVLSFPAACCCRLARNDTNRLFQVCGWHLGEDQNPGGTGLPRPH